MPDQLLRSNAQAAEGPLVLDGETLIGIIVKETYTFSAAHELASEVTAFEVEPASEESRLTGTASVILDDAEVAWLVLVSGSTAVDLSDVTDRGGIVWVRPGDTDADRQIVGFAADPGDADATYLPTWPDGLYAELIAPVDTTSGTVETVAGVAPVGGDVPAEDLAAALSIESGGATLLEADVILATADVDGTATTFEVLQPSSAAEADGIVPAGWVSVYSVPDLATLEGLLAFAGVTETATIIVPDQPTAFAVPADALDQPWPEATGTLAFSQATTLLIAHGGVWVPIDASRIAYRGTGLLDGITSVFGAVHGFEGFLDNHRDVAGYFTAAVTDLATLMAGPVADLDQPVTDDGHQVVKGDKIATLGDVDEDGNGWVRIVNPTTGQWGVVPSNGTITPTGADSWANAVTTNRLIGGCTILTAGGVFAMYVSDRGGPDPVSAEHDPTGEWVFVGDGTAGATTDASDLTSGTLAFARLPIGSTSSTVRAGDDAAYTDARTPTAHNHAAADINSGTLAIARIPTGTSGTTVALGNDSRFTDTRTPTDASVTSAKLATSLAETMATTVFASGTSVTSSTTLVDAAGLGFAVVSGKRYTIDGILFATGADTGDIKIACTHPGGTMAVQFTGHLISASAAGTIPAQMQAPLDTSGAAQNWGLTTTGTVGLPFRGSFTASSSGTFQVQFAQRVSDATATQILSSSYLTYRVA